MEAQNVCTMIESTHVNLQYFNNVAINADLKAPTCRSRGGMGLTSRPPLPPPTHTHTNIKTRGTKGPMVL